jgi:inner membrane protein
MDNLTHTLVGLMLARASTRADPSGDPSGNRTHTTGMMMIAANIPDVDAVSMLGGGLTYIEYHRSYTHSLAFAPLMALIAPLLIFAIFRTRITARTYALSLAGVLSHLLLDWTNVYGIRLFLPFSSRVLRLDITDVIDPWIWLMLLLAVAAPALARLVNAEIRSQPVSRSGPGPKRGWACFALAMLLLYEGARYIAHDRALAIMGARLFNGEVPRRLTAAPARFNPLRWRGIAECEGFVDLVPVNLNEPFDPAAGEIDYSASPSPAIDAARATHAFQVFGRFSQVQFWRTTPLPEGTLVQLIDLRFGTPRDPGFEAAALVDASNRVLESQFGFGGIPVRGP